MVLPSIGNSFGSVMYYSIIYVVLFAGLFLGSLLTSILKTNGKIISFFWSISGLSLMIFGVADLFLFKAISLLIFGLCLGVINVLSFTYIQIITKKEMMGRIMSTLNTCGSLSMPLGSLIGGLLALKLNISLIIILSGIAISICGISLFLIRDVRTITFQKEIS
ncbi:MFS transporter [Pseudalkalibacillus sp. R45]|uniref:MFS transporter n=1 Tax=Pseudalkalibacillus sp. R45 TaxID=3457433 RepID=UPI003FCD1DB5